MRSADEPAEESLETVADSAFELEGSIGDKIEMLALSLACAVGGKPAGTIFLGADSVANDDNAELLWVISLGIIAPTASGVLAL